jgi:catalase (peroxidase I)
MMLSKILAAISIAQQVLAFQPTVTRKVRSETTTQLYQANDRRSFLLSSGSALIVASTTLAAPSNSLADAPSVDYKAVAADIATLVAADADKGPTLVRLAWHSSGTYDKMSKDGGSGPGTIRFKEELAHGGNAGLGETAVQWMEPIHEKYAAAGLSYADLYTLGGGRCLVCEMLL